MIIYVDLVFFINLIMDFYIITGVKFLNKINVKLYRLVLGSIFGSLSTILLFFSLSTILLNILKIIISIFMILISFGKKKFFNNLFYLYIISILLGGSILIVISPLIIYLYSKEFLKFKRKINTTYEVTIKFKNKELILNGFLDTGNKLVDPYFHRPIILVNKKYINLRGKKIIYVPFSSLNNSSLLKCITCEYILVNGNKISNVLIGISENLEYDLILNERILDYE